MNALDGITVAAGIQPSAIFANGFSAGFAFALLLLGMVGMIRTRRDP